jgi:uncharacterized protein (UPF0212 family)
VTGLLPDVVHDAVQSKTIYAASESFGVVALVLLVLLLLELEVLKVTRRSHAHSIVVQAMALPLLVAVVLTIFLRVTGLLK